MTTFTRRQRLVPFNLSGSIARAEGTEMLIDPFTAIMSDSPPVTITPNKKPLVPFHNLHREPMSTEETTNTQISTTFSAPEDIVPDFSTESPCKKPRHLHEEPAPSQSESSSMCTAEDLVDVPMVPFRVGGGIAPPDQGAELVLNTFDAPGGVISNSVTVKPNKKPLVPFHNYHQDMADEPAAAPLSHSDMHIAEQPAVAAPSNSATLSQSDIIRVFAKNVDYLQTKAEALSRHAAKIITMALDLDQKKHQKIKAASVHSRRSLPQLVAKETLIFSEGGGSGRSQRMMDTSW